MAEVVKNDQEYSTKKKIAQPPLNLLFNPSLIQRDDVWKIDVVKLLEILLSTLTSSTYKDLRLCGVAILTSTLIHRLMQNTLSIPLGLTAGILISFLAWKAGSLSRSGAIAAAITGGLIFGLGGLPWAALLLTFFISSSALSRAFRMQKRLAPGFYCCFAEFP